PDMSSWRPSGTAAAVNECPAPTGLTVRPSAAAVRTAAATCSAEAGRTTRTGVARWLPAQFDQSAGAGMSKNLLMVAVVPGLATPRPQICQVGRTVVAARSLCRKRLWYTIAGRPQSHERAIGGT